MKIVFQAKQPSMTHKRIEATHHGYRSQLTPLPVNKRNHLLYLVSFMILSMQLNLSGCADRGVETPLSLEKDFGEGVIPEGFDASYLDAFMDMEPQIDLCDPNPCPNGQRCQNLSMTEYECLSLSCAELDCGPNTRCEDQGDGAQCVDELCQDEGDCAATEFCNQDGLCQTDLCTANERYCIEDTIEICKSDGSGSELWVTCPLGVTQCSEQPRGSASCLCEDDWDCPTFLRCDRGLCTGRPEEPSCLLPPRPFQESLPTTEIVWGGTADNVNAVGSPFPESSQVVMTPIVANLNDDNGDGLIDEGDTPEILFMTFCNRDFRSNGALRAIHGGGPRKGTDLFASVGEDTWYEGQDSNNFNPNCADAILDSTAGIAVGNLDAPNSPFPEPEVVAIHESGGIVIYDNLGEIAAYGLVNQSPNVGGNPTPSIAQLDGQGMAEIIVSRVVYTLEREGNELRVIDQFVGLNSLGVNGQGGVSCVADINQDGISEIIAGGSAYRLPQKPARALSTDDCQTNGGQIPAQSEEEEAWCRGELLTLWYAPHVNEVRTPPISNAPNEGFCAVADIWGSDHSLAPSPENPLDGTPEVILILNGFLYILEGETGNLIYAEQYGGGSDRGGAPNIGDFDGDGFPEVGSAFASGYVMMDLQTPTTACPEWLELTVDEQDNGTFNRPPRMPGEACTQNLDCADGAYCISGQCRCGHQGWHRRTEDASSKVTGSTLFDFNGDGAVEVIYNDECFFRIYDGSTGMTLFRQPSESRTRIEHPIVADVDADGNAEIVFSTSTESGFCSIRNQTNVLGQSYASLYNPGIEVWGDPRDLWVSARKIWNQHAYHVTSITESGQVPLIEPKGWLEERGRSYNTYRSQPLSFGLAPDLEIVSFRATASRGGCNQEQAMSNGLSINLSITVRNQGEVQVGPNLPIAISARWLENQNDTPLQKENGEPLVLFTSAPLLPGTSTTLTVTYDPQLDPSQPLTLYGVETPFDLKAVVDPVDQGSDMNNFGRERECEEGNNEKRATTQIIDQVADLVLILDEISTGFCPELNLELSLTNQGTSSVSRVELGLYLGDPRQGGSRIDSRIVEETIDPNTTINIEWQSATFPEYRSAQVFVIADPANVINECQEDNNIAFSEERISCQVRDGK